MAMRHALPKALAKLIPEATKSQTSVKPRSLYETLSRLPNDGVGSRVFQTRWQSKGIQGCFWEVTRVKLKCEGQHGKAWGKLVWRGRVISEKEERIPGALKYMWSPGLSKGKNLSALHDIESAPVTEWQQLVSKPGETETDMKTRLSKEARERQERITWDRTIEEALREAGGL